MLLVAVYFTFQIIIRGSFVQNGNALQKNLYRFQENDVKFNRQDAENIIYFMYLDRKISW